jgi:hypothetical protein
MWTTVSFWIEIPSPSFSKAKVTSVIQNKPYEPKNKKFKPQEAIPYLTLFLKALFIYFYCRSMTCPFNLLLYACLLFEFFIEISPYENIKKNATLS